MKIFFFGLSPELCECLLLFRFFCSHFFHRLFFIFVLVVTRNFPIFAPFPPFNAFPAIIPFAPGPQQFVPPPQVVTPAKQTCICVPIGTCTTTGTPTNPIDGVIDIRIVNNVILF